MQSDFRRGLKAGLPIGLGYLSVSFAFGIQAMALGLTPLEAVLISMTNLTSAGQLAGITLMAGGAPLLEMALTQLTINLRYALMSLSLSQKMGEDMGTGRRMIFAFGNTDEIFAVASMEKGNIRFPYALGLMVLPYIGWSGGTLLGAVAGSLCARLWGLRSMACSWQLCCRWRAESARCAWWPCLRRFSVLPCDTCLSCQACPGVIG